jgi:hypothetical protein
MEMGGGQRDARASLLADLGPLPEVTESDTDTSWRMFLELQEQHTTGFLKTEPSALTPLDDGATDKAPNPTAQDVLLEARRLNRVCPSEAQWNDLYALLATAGAGAPTPMAGAEFRTASSLVKRVRVREQVQWAADHGLLPQVLRFFRGLAEDEWVHMEL